MSRVIRVGLRLRMAVMTQFTTKNIAVVGSGIAGLGAAWALSRRHDVTLFERDMRLGGHSRTIDVPMGEQLVPVDTGFIVYNERNYPNLTRLFETLDVPTEPSDMSFAVSRPGFEFAASPSAVLRHPRQLASRRVWDVLRGIARFRSHVANHETLDGVDVTLIDYLEANGLPKGFVDDYLLPLTAAVWSGSGAAAASMPVAVFLEFLANHGLFDVDRPQWRTVSGGSREYVERVAKAIPRIRTGTAVHQVNRIADGVELVTGDGIERCDEVVLATHAPLTLGILGDAATADEREILGAFRYAPNRAVVHSDPAFMPRRRSAWSSWNSIGDIDTDSPVTVTYWMNRLQNLDRRHPVFVTLNPRGEPRHVMDDVVFAHPQFTPETAAAQRRLGEIQGVDRVWYAGAWAGYGFHEDGLQSGLTVAAALGAPAPWQDSITAASSAARHARPRVSR
jgi:uncharacterized protein